MSSRSPNPRQVGTVPVRPRSLDDAIIVADNETYNVADLELFNTQGAVRHTISRTILHGHMQTRGHAHSSPAVDEVYYFAQGEGIMLLNNDAKMVTAGDYILVEGGVFHKIINTTKEDMVFICFFPSKANRPPFTNVVK